MQIIRAHDCRPTPWKNGGGSTTEIAVAPPGASLDDFDWRISMAQVATNGPFSQFPEIDRTLALVKGNGLALTIADAGPVKIECDSAPLSFPGDVPASARLIAGEITDLNVMTRRRRFSHRLQRIQKPATFELEVSDVAVVLSFNGSTKLASGRSITTLNHADAAVLPRAPSSTWIAPSGAGLCYLVLLRPL